jgi:uncharacterized protein YgiM (DUF1202 family)
MPDLRSVRERVRRGEGQSIPSGGPVVETQGGGLGWLVPAVIAGILLVIAMMVFGGRLKSITQPSQSFYVTRTVNLRSAPTSIGSRVLGSLTRGTRVEGRIVPDAAPDAQYVKIGEGPAKGRYLWSRNLSPNPRPGLRSGGFAARARRATPLYAEPDSAAEVLDNLPKGTGVVVIGSVDGGWYELSLRRGGVGYVAASAF